MRDEIAAYDNKKHKLRVDVMPPKLVSFCGQQYAGAKNYHDAPAFFVDRIREVMQEEVCRLTQVAYEREIARLDSIIESHREQVLQELSQE